MFHSASAKKQTIIENLYAGQAGHLPTIAEHGDIWFLGDNNPVDAVCIARDDKTHTYSIEVEGVKL